MELLNSWNEITALSKCDVINFIAGEENCSSEGKLSFKQGYHNTNRRCIIKNPIFLDSERRVTIHSGFFQTGCWRMSYLGAVLNQYDRILPFGHFH